MQFPMQFPVVTWQITTRINSTKRILQEEYRLLPNKLTSYLEYWMGDEGIPLIEKWDTTGKLDYTNADETPTTEGGRRRLLSSGYKLKTYWDLLEEEFKPKGNKLLSIIEFWTHSIQGSKTLNEWLTYVHNLVNICRYPEDFTDSIY